MSLLDIFSNAPAQDAAAAQTAGINAGYGQLSDLSQQGRGALTTNFSAALKPFQANYDVASGGQQAYADATGANGPAGLARAQAQFQTSPGYQFQLDQGIGAVNANAEKLGQAASGNTNLDLLKFGQGLANTDWGNYVSRLQPFLGQASTAAQGIGTVDTGLGTALNANLTNQGNAAYGAQTSIGNANANADLSRYNTSANALGALAGGLGLGANLFGKFG